MKARSMRSRWSIPMLAALLLAGCGGGGGGGGSSPVQPTQNVQPITVDGGPASISDVVFTSVTFCTPGSATNCQTIDHILVDTGSVGLRIISSVLSPTLSLPQQVDANGNPLVECAQFADGFSWGPVKVADIRIAGEMASSVPVQVIGDATYPTIPAACSSSGPPENTVPTFGANGLLGVGLFLQDCGAGCAQSAIAGAYYGCPSSGCRPTQVALNKQLQNPVALFGTDNNGVIIQLPAVPAAGAATASGSLIFGIGTQANNGLGSATVLTADPNTGYIGTTFNGLAYTNSYIDSGASVLFFGSSAYPICTGDGAGLYCPPSTQNLSATLQGVNKAAITAAFNVANADQLFRANPDFFAFSNVAAPNSDAASFAWGLPFFFGRSVYTAIETRSTPGGTGPYFAF
jgi:Protein of unknown function (DUF3443)